MRLKHSRISRVLAALAAGAIALPPSLPVAAGPAMEKLFFIMKAKGSLSQEEYDLLVAASREEDKERDKAAVAAAPAPAPAPAEGQTPNTAALEKRLAQAESKVNNLENALAPGHLEKRLAQTESKVGNLENVLTSTRGQIEDISRITDNTSPSTMSSAELDVLLADKWYERLKMKGYLQVRTDSVMHEDGGQLHVQNDSFANGQSSLGIRRGRMAFSGDLTNHVYLYFQADLLGGVNGSGGVQARDYYADVSLDPAREHRVRLGLSKVPYGHSILQSSQNRLALERPEALSTAVEGERDFGIYYMYAPYEIRERFKSLVKMGLRGSGDYGMIALGAYSGQGINRPDTNGQPHWVARATYPFEFDNGQFLELSVQGYAGKFNTTTANIPGVGTPANGNGSNRGFTDARVGISAILYPQPFGIETEWNWGKGPQLSNDMRTITSSSLSGGYVQANYRHVFANQREFIPFARWQTYNGGRKFATNAPKDKVNEVGIGFRFIPYPELELTAMFMHGMRTNTSVAPYNTVNYDYLGIQAQVNF
ncbi:MAG: OprO/OprP family phosphate-selective porin [Prosthecobacter sp.]|uniref:porin n=1 Tax=Prosthecobacter sp. TaxID=1965333 RepID=UPI002613D7DC|nr:porin [Prosthecobacter sp.]MCF7789094.1 OprO/OprP family phosphate-selective porin [Prosthecobacter sp.]